MKIISKLLNRPANFVPSGAKEDAVGRDQYQLRVLGADEVKSVAGGPQARNDQLLVEGPDNQGG